MKNKKGLLKVTALAVAGCLFTLSMHVNAFAEEAVGEEDSTITKEEQNDFEILRWEIGNMGMDGEIQTEDSEADSYGIMTYTS